MYWIAYKRRHTDRGSKRVYISGFGVYGEPLHSFDEKDAFHFVTFDSAVQYRDLGYAICKEG